MFSTDPLFDNFAVSIGLGLGGQPWGWFFRADTDELPRPLLIATNGYDATLYEMYVAQAQLPCDGPA